MTFAAVNLKLVGASLIALAVLHCFFPRRFNWRHELADITLLTRQMFYVHTFFIALTVALMGLLALLYSNDLLSGSRLARAVSTGLALFWGARLMFQWFVYDPTLWRGHRFNTIIHVVFTMLWAWYTATFSYAALM